MTNVSNYYIDSKNKLISDKESYIIGNKYRFTILTPRMIRLEYSINGVFEDRPTSLVINRSFPKVPYSITESNTLIQIDTGIFTLSYVKDSDFKSTTFGSNIKAVINIQRIGSRIGKSKNFIIIPLIRTAAHPKTSSNKCRLTTLSLITFPLAVL